MEKLPRAHTRHDFLRMTNSAGTSHDSRNHLWMDESIEIATLYSYTYCQTSTVNELLARSALEYIYQIQHKSQCNALMTSCNF